MKKLFTQKLKLCATLCALFALGCPNAAADDNDPADGYYFIVNRDVYKGYTYTEKGKTIKIAGETSKRAWRLFPYSHKLVWDYVDYTQPEQIFYLKKATEKTTNAYYLQSLADGSWYYGQASDNNLYMLTNNDLKNTLDFEKQDDGTFLIKPTILRSGATKGSLHEYLSTHVGDNTGGRDATLWQSTNKKSGTCQDNWILQPVTEDQLNAARQKMKRHDNTLIKAYNVYNSNLAYNESSAGLINTITEEPTDVYYGKGTQIFVSYKENGDDNQKANNKFVNITRTWTAGQFFQTSLSSSNKYADGTTNIEAPQFFQVDLQKQVKGVRMEMNATNYNDRGWCSSSQWADVTLFATNDEDAAFNCYTIAQCEQSDKWVKIGEFEPDLSKSLIKKTTTARNDGSTESFSYLTKSTTENKIYNTLWLKNTGYRYVRFFVNNEPFPNLKVMNYVFTGFQLYELEDVNVIGSKKYLVNQLLNAEKTYEDILKNTSTTPTEAEVQALSNAIEAVENNASVSISAIGYSTFVSDEKVKLADGLEAYIVTGNTTTDGQNYATLKKIADAGQTLPANTPVLIKGAKGDYVLPISTEDAVSITDENLLKGKARAITSQTSGDNYTLQSNGTSPVFKKYTGTSLNAGYAYLPVSSTSDSPAFLNLSFADPTGIQSAVNAEKNEGKTYDLEGRSVKHPQKGIYIRGGKKVIIK